MGRLVSNMSLMADAVSTLIAVGVFFFCGVLGFCCSGVFTSSDFAAVPFWLGVSVLKMSCRGFFFGVVASGDQTSVHLFGACLVWDAQILLANPLSFVIVNDFDCCFQSVRNRSLFLSPF